MFYVDLDEIYLSHNHRVDTLQPDKHQTTVTANYRHTHYNTIHSRHSTHCVECYRPHASVGTTTPKIDRKPIDGRKLP